MNLVESISRASEYLGRHDVSSARLNAELLLCDVLGLTRVELYTNYSRPMSERETAVYRELLVERAKGCPLQYLTGATGFRGLTFEVCPGVLIPRPETEVLVERSLGLLGEGDAAVLDLGTGCGNIATSIAVEHEGARVTAVDIDPLALELCERNARRHGVSGRVLTLMGDLYDALEGLPAAETFDLVVSNPPYVRLEDWEGLEREVRDFEPREALVAGVDGLDVIERVVAGAPGRLRETGWIALEVNECHADEVARRVLDRGVWECVECEDDLAGRPRVVTARLRGDRPCNS